MNEQQGLDPMFQENGSQWMEGGLASEPLNVYTAKTFGWMFLGLLVTFGTAIAFSAGGGLYYLLTMGMPAYRDSAAAVSPASFPLLKNAAAARSASSG